MASTIGAFHVRFPVRGYMDSGLFCFVADHEWNSAIYFYRQYADESYWDPDPVCLAHGKLKLDGKSALGVVISVVRFFLRPRVW